MMLNPSVQNVDIIVASFGVISKLTTNKIYTLDMVRHVVLDEADALFDETFEDKLKVFLKRVPVRLHVCSSANYLSTMCTDLIKYRNNFRSALCKVQMILNFRVPLNLR